MAELDDRLLRDLARLRERSGPPPGAEQRVRAALEAGFDPDPGGGDDGGSALGDGGLGSAGLGGGSKLAIGAKVLAAAATVTGAAVLIVKLDVMTPEQQAREPAPVDAEATTVEPRSRTQPRGVPEPPILVTAPDEPIPVQRPTVRDEDPLAAELELLEQARAANDLQARLKLLEQHREQFEAGVLAAERESLRISTLCELDQLDAARQAAEDFLLAHPRSPLLLRMRSACPKLDNLTE